jgi:hypothetical protein
MIGMSPVDRGRVRLACRGKVYREGRQSAHNGYILFQACEVPDTSMTPDVTVDSLVVRAIRQYREKTYHTEEEAGGEKEPGTRPQRSYSLSGMAQSCLGCDLLHAEECGERHRKAELPCRDRQVLILMAKRRIASL